MNSSSTCTFGEMTSSVEFLVGFIFNRHEFVYRIIDVFCTFLNTFRSVYVHKHTHTVIYNLACVFVLLQEFCCLFTLFAALVKGLGLGLVKAKVRRLMCTRANCGPLLFTAAAIFAVVAFVFCSLLTLGTAKSKWQPTSCRHCCPQRVEKLKRACYPCE